MKWTTVDRIIETSANAAFLAEARALGYKPYINSSKVDRGIDPPNFYLGSVQRCVEDDQGKRYFIGIDMFDLGAFRPDAPDPFSAEASVQFHIEDAHARVFDASMKHESFDATEGFFDEVWRKMRLGYYERF